MSVLRRFCAICRRWRELKLFGIHENGSQDCCRTCRKKGWFPPDILGKQPETREIRDKGFLPIQYPPDREDKRLMKQVLGGMCCICGETVEYAHVDHNHATGYCRGILCPQCNNGLGFFKDDPRLVQKAAQYLMNPPWPQP
jgi:hypothetical protein